MSKWNMARNRQRDSRENKMTGAVPWEWEGRKKEGRKDGWWRMVEYEQIERRERLKGSVVF